MSEESNPEKPAEKKHLGIPKAEFLDDVDAFMKLPGNTTVRDTLLKLEEQYQKYRFMESNLNEKKKKLKVQIPDIKATLETIKHLQSQKKEEKASMVNFLLSDGLYASAQIPPTDKVCLWLGANVMLEYTIAEAKELLRKNQSSATENLVKVNEDLNFLRNQLTTMEVNMARVHNWDVKRRSQEAVKSHS